MFCSNCGNEILTPGKFCPKCGAETSEKGICGCGDFRTLREMTEKADKSRKKCCTVIRALTVVYVIYFGWNICRRMAEVTRGTRELGSVTAGIAALILVTCALLGLILQIVLPLIRIKKSAYTEEYLKRIQVKDNRTLMHALGQMQCRTVKGVYMGDNGDVCVQGRKCEHIFTVTDGTLTLTSKKNNPVAALERETISACLLKFVSPDAPVNAHENEQNNIKLQRLRGRLAAVAVICGIVLIVLAVSQGGGGRYIRAVKNAHPKAYPDVSYGEAFDYFFDDCDWKYFESTGGEKVVEFHGTNFLDGRTAEMDVQFVISEEQDGFELYALSLDGEMQPELIQGMVLVTLFELYVEGEGGDSWLDNWDMDDGWDEDDGWDDAQAPDDDWDETLDLDNGGDDDLINLSGFATWEELQVFSGLWTDGTDDVSISIYSDADSYLAFDEIGTVWIGDISGNLYLQGTSGTDVYVRCQLESGDEMTFCYKSDGTIEVQNASEGCILEEGAMLLCMERYIS